MRTLRDCLLCLLLATLTASTGYLATCGGVLLKAFAAAPELLADRITDVQRTLDAMPGQVLPPVLAEVRHQGDGLRRDAATQLTALRGDAMQRVDRLNGTVEDAVTKADGQITGLRGELTPVLRQSAALVKDAQDTLDDAYPDVRGLLESSSVAATQIAQTAETARIAAPQFLNTVQETNRQFAGIATDVHKFTTRFTAPVSFRAKVWEGFKSVALIGSHF